MHMYVSLSCGHVFLYELLNKWKHFTIWGIIGSTSNVTNYYIALIIDIIKYYYVVRLKNVVNNDSRH